MLLRIIRSLRFLARQGLSLRGDSSDSDSNFMQLLQLQSVDCSELGGWLQKKTNKYTSHDVQNEILKLMALEILRNFCHQIRENRCHTIMADECTDVSNREQFTVCIRTVGEDLHDREDFIGLYGMDKIDSKSLFEAISGTLLRINVQLSSCRSQCYDGTSNTSGSRNGVVTQIAAQEKCALYIHCFAHCLNHAVSDTMKSSMVCRVTLEMALR